MSSCSDRRELMGQAKKHACVRSATRGCSNGVRVGWWASCLQLKNRDCKCVFLQFLKTPEHINIYKPTETPTVHQIHSCNDEALYVSRCSRVKTKTLNGFFKPVLLSWQQFLWSLNDEFNKPTRNQETSWWQCKEWVR